MCDLHMRSEHIGQWNAPHSLYKLEMKYNCFHGFHPIVLVYFGYLKVFCISIFKLSLVLEFENFSFVYTFDVKRHGAIFLYLLSKCSELEVLSHQYRNLIPPV